METRQNLQDFASSLAKQPRGGLKEEVLEPAFSADVRMPVNYVWPDLLDATPQNESSVVLVTAPGAMGKSVAAKALASSINAPLVDLAKVPIGSDSLTGLLTRVLGWNQAPDFVKRLRDGSAALVLDSLDEAQLAAGQAHFVAFLRNVAELLKGGEFRSQVVIFGRRDTVETAELVLNGFGVEPRLLSVSALTYGQSCSLIDLVLDDVVIGQKQYKTHRTHSVPFGNYRDSVLLDMAHALGGKAEAIEDCWPAVGDFLGYPPVLLVMARHLVVENPAALGGKSHSHGTSETRGGLLREVTEEIMTRESQKVRTQLAPVLGLADDDPRTELLYTHDEQVARLAAHLLGRPLAVPLPSSLTSDEAIVYQDQIETFLPDHPFLRGRDFENVVFSDYVRAYMVVADDGLGVHDLGSSLSAATTVGPFFAHFLHAMAPRVEREGGWRVASIAESLVDSVIKSFSASSSLVTEFIYSDRNDVGLLFLAEESDDAEQRRILSTLFFEVADLSGLLELSSPLSRGLIVSQGGLSITASTDEVVLGPDLSMIVDDFYLEGRRFSVASSSAAARHTISGGVMIIARGDVSHAHDIRISAHPPDTLKVGWRNLAYQWHAYELSTARSGLGVPQALSWQVVFGLKRLLSVFHASAAKDPSLFGERLDRFAVGSNPVFAATLEGLIELDVIARTGDLYRLRLARLGEFGVSYAALRGPDFAETLVSLHQEVLKTGALRRIIAEAAED